MALYFCLFALADTLLPAFVAHREVEVVATEKKLVTRGDNVHILVKAGVDYSLRAAGANGFYLCNRVGKLEEPAAAREEMCEEVCTKTEAKNGYVAVVNDSAKLVDMRLGEELTFVGNNYVTVGVLLGENLVNIVLLCDSVAGSVQTNARANRFLTVAVVNGRLDKPNLHITLLVIELGNENLRGF